MSEAGQQLDRILALFTFSEPFLKASTIKIKSVLHISQSALLFNYLSVNKFLWLLKSVPRGEDNGDCRVSALFLRDWHTGLNVDKMADSGSAAVWFGSTTWWL